MSLVSFKRGAWTGVVCQLLPSALVAALFAAVGVVHVTSRVMVLDAGYRFSKLEEKVRALARENDQLKIEVATLKSPVRLEKIARERLGMVAPDGAAVMTVRADR